MDKNSKLIFTSLRKTRNKNMNPLLQKTLFTIQPENQSFPLLTDLHNTLLFQKGATNRDK